MWLRFLKEINEKTRDILTGLNACCEICEAIELCEEVCYSEAGIRTYDKCWDNVSREKTLLSSNYNEGFATGFAESRAKERRTLARNLIDRGFSAEQTSELTGLPIETVTKILLQK